MNITNKFPIGVPYFSPECNIELCDEDFEFFEKIRTMAQTITSTLGLQMMELKLTPTFQGPFFNSMYSILSIPTCCFPEKTRKTIDQIALKHLNIDLDMQKLEEIAIAERKLTQSLTDQELEFCIGHEIGHYWLHTHFKAFESPSLKVNDASVTELKHDRALR